MAKLEDTCAMCLICCPLILASVIYKLMQVGTMSILSFSLLPLLIHRKRYNKYIHNFGWSYILHSRIANQILVSLFNCASFLISEKNNLMELFPFVALDVHSFVNIAACLNLHIPWKVQLTCMHCYLIMPSE
jgi:hypothetical protein